MFKLICTFVVLIWQKQIFSWRGSSGQWHAFRIRITNSSVTTVQVAQAYPHSLIIVSTWHSMGTHWTNLFLQTEKTYLNVRIFRLIWVVAWRKGLLKVFTMSWLHRPRGSHAWLSNRANNVNRHKCMPNVYTIYLSLQAAKTFSLDNQDENVDVDKRRPFDSIGHGFSGFVKRPFDSISSGGGLQGFVKRPFDSISGDRMSGFVKRPFDSISGDRMSGFVKRPFDSINRGGLKGFVKRIPDGADEDVEFVDKKSFDSINRGGLSGFVKRPLDSISGHRMSGFVKRPFDSISGDRMSGFVKRPFDSISDHRMSGFVKRPFDSISGHRLSGFAKRSDSQGTNDKE